MNTKSVSILGVGFLGLPLARQLIQQGLIVKGSTISEDKVTILTEENVEPYIINCMPRLQFQEINHSLEEFFNSDVLFLNIPFKRNLEDPQIYYDQIKQVVSFAEQSSVQNIIFASSTSVYPEIKCEFKEESEFETSSSRSATLLAIENFLLDNAASTTTVIRFGGLYGNNRKIGRFLAGRKDLEEGNKPVNLIHVDDCVGITIGIIKRGVKNEIFNAVSDLHPTRRELYTQAALSQGFEPPAFKKDDGDEYKIINNDKVKNVLEYTFKYPDPVKSIHA